MDEFAKRVYYYAAGAYYVWHWLVLGGVPVAALGAWIASVPNSSLILSSLVVVSGVGALLTGGLSSILLSRHRTRVRNPDLAIVREETVYDVSRDPYRLVMEVEVQAGSDGVESHMTKFAWSGKGEMKVHVEEPFECLLHPSPGPWQPFDIVEVLFPHPLRRGERTAFVLELEANDVDHSANPILNKLIDDYYPNGVLFTAILPPALRNARIEAAIYPSRYSKLPLKAPSLMKCDLTTGKVTWSVRRPRLDFQYRLTWGKVASAWPKRTGHRDLTVPVLDPAAQPNSTLRAEA